MTRVLIRGIIHDINKWKEVIYVSIIAGTLIVLGSIVWIYKLYQWEYDKTLVADCVATWIMCLWLNSTYHTQVSMALASMMSFAMAMTLYEAYEEKSM